MKKKYQIPEIEVMAAETSELVCTSLQESGKAVDHGIKSADSRYKYWDDEEE